MTAHVRQTVYWPSLEFVAQGPTIIIEYGVRGDLRQWQPSSMEGRQAFHDALDRWLDQFMAQEGGASHLEGERE